MRGGDDYPRRERVIDPRVAGAGVLGSRIKDRVNHGHTVPRVGKTVSTQTNAARMHAMNRRKGTHAGTQTGAHKAKLANSSATVYNFHFSKGKKRCWYPV